MNSEETLKYIIKCLLNYMEELKNSTDNSLRQFEYGEKTAYTECLEMVQLWNKSAKYGLNFDIESKYPL